LIRIRAASSISNTIRDYQPVYYGSVAKTTLFTSGNSVCTGVWLNGVFEELLSSILMRNSFLFEHKGEVNMAYEERQTEHSRVVVETPRARHEEVHTEAVHYPERNNGGISGAALAAIVVGVVALAAIIILFVMNQQSAVNDNATAQQPAQTIVQQPAQQPPVIVQQPAPATQPAPVIINGQTMPATTTTTTSSGPDDSTVQAAVDKKLSDDPQLSTLGIIATVASGKATLTGSVANQATKNQVERAVRSVKGVKTIDNQITVTG
jgi:flagellar basal body-associated protein FliL